MKFTTNSDDIENHIFLRDYFAVEAMDLVFKSGWYAITNHQEIAKKSYELADAMIKERDKYYLLSSKEAYKLALEKTDNLI